MTSTLMIIRETLLYNSLFRMKADSATKTILMSRDEKQGALYKGDKWFLFEKIKYEVEAHTPVVNVR